MKLTTEGTMIKVVLDKEDVYEGHHQSEDGLYGVHKFLIMGCLPMTVHKHFSQIMEVETHDKWEIDQKANGELIMGPDIDLWNERMAQGMTLAEARAWQPYRPKTNSQP